MDKRKTQVSKAIEIALRHPDGLHPLQVAVEAMKIQGDSDDFEAFLVGLLHDSIEDGYSNFEELMIFGDRVVHAVGVLTRGDGESYWDYIERVKTYGGKLAKRVKVADATVNLSRCTNELGYQSLRSRYAKVIAELAGDLT